MYVCLDRLFCTSKQDTDNCYDRRLCISKADTFHDLHFKTRYFLCSVKNLAAFFIPLLMLCKSIFKHHNSNLHLCPMKPDSTICIFTDPPSCKVYQYLFFVCNRRSCIYRGSENSTKSRTCGTSRGSTSRSCVSSDWTSSWQGSRSSLTSWRRCTRWLRWAETQSWSWSTPSTRSQRASCSGKLVKLYNVYFTHLIINNVRQGWTVVVVYIF